MGNEHEQSHASPTAAEAVRDHDQVEPGQSSHSALLRKPDHAISSGLVQRDARGSDEPSNAQRGYFSLILVPMWQGQLGALSDTLRHYRTHLLALECLRVAIGPGGDPVQVAEFCRKWQIPLTLPVIGPTAILRRAAKAFDPTGAINIGIKLIAHMAPLLGKLQLHNAQIVALDPGVVNPRDTTLVLEILSSSSNPKDVIGRVEACKAQLASTWATTISFAESMESKRRELGIPENIDWSSDQTNTAPPATE